MTFKELVERRQSVRAYQDKPVPREKLERCIEAARLAPSACNSQPWTFVVVDQEPLLGTLADETISKVLSLNKFAPQVPAFVVVVTEASNFSAKLGGVVKSKAYNLIDIGIATEHFCLQAVEEGLGTCIIGWFDEPAVKKLLNIPKKKRVNIVIAVGYASDEAIREKRRKAFGEICRYNTY